jgi:hypothetical protein
MRARRSWTVAIVSRWFAQRNRALDHDQLHAPTPAEGWEDAVTGNVFTVADTSDRLGTNQIDDFVPLAARVLEAEGIVVDTTLPPTGHCCGCWCGRICVRI